MTFVFAAMSSGRPPGEVRVGDAVVAVELHVRNGGCDVLVELHGVRGRDPAEEEAVDALARQVLGLRPVVRGLRVDAAGVDELVVELLRRQLDVGREALAEDLVVVQDSDRRAAVLVHQRRERGALDRVLGDDAGVVACPGRVVDVRLADLGIGSGLIRGQSDGGVAGREHRHPVLVQDRDRDRRGAGVEGAEVGDRGLILRCALRVRRLRLRRPRTGLGGRVVERLEVDADAAGLVAGLGERKLDPVLDRDAGRAGGALQRQARVDRHLTAGSFASV